MEALALRCLVRDSIYLLQQHNIHFTPNNRTLFEVVPILGCSEVMQSVVCNYM